MSNPSESNQSASDRIEVETLLDALVRDGNLEVESVKGEAPALLGQRNVSYGFTTHDGFSVRAVVYWVVEDSRPRQYLWMECALTKLGIPHPDVMDFLLRQNQRLPAIIKMALSEDLVVACVRSPVDGLNPEHLKELIDGFLPTAAHLFQDISKKFRLPSLRDQLQQESQGVVH